MHKQKNCLQKLSLTWLVCVALQWSHWVIILLKISYLYALPHHRSESFVSSHDAWHFCDILSLDIIGFRRWLGLQQAMVFQLFSTWGKKQSGLALLTHTGPFFMAFCSGKEILEQEMHKLSRLQSSFSLHFSRSCCCCALCLNPFSTWYFSR